MLMSCEICRVQSTTGYMYMKRCWCLRLLLQVEDLGVTGTRNILLWWWGSSRFPEQLRDRYRRCGKKAWRAIGIACVGRKFMVSLGLGALGHCNWRIGGYGN